MASTRFFFLTLAALALSMFPSVAVAAETRSHSSSLSQPQRLGAAEGTFVRGLMAADHQFGLYMTVAETSRGGSAEDEEDGPMHPIAQVRHAAVNFADVVRRRAFSPINSRQSTHGGH